MEPDQRKLYNQLRQHYRNTLLKRVETDGLAKSKMMVLEALLRLRQAACHPGLIDAKRVEEPSAKLDTLLIPDPTLKATPFAWLRNASTSPKPDHVRALLDRLRFVRDMGVPPEAAARAHDDRFQQLLREGRISDAHQIGRYAAHRRRAILGAEIIDLETRLTDGVLDIADKLIGGPGGDHQKQ